MHVTFCRTRAFVWDFGPNVSCGSLIWFTFLYSIYGLNNWMLLWFINNVMTRTFVGVLISGRDHKVIMCDLYEKEKSNMVVQ